MGRSIERWRRRLARRACVRAREVESGAVLTVRRVMAVSRAAVGKQGLEIGPAAGVIRYTRTTAGLTQWDAFTAMKVPGVVWRSYEAGQTAMPAAVWARFQAWLEKRRVA